MDTNKKRVYTLWGRFYEKKSTNIFNRIQTYGSRRLLIWKITRNIINRKKYGIPNDYTVSRWTIRYNEFGKEGLENKRGKIRRKLESKELTNEEKTLYLEAENAYLRKVLEHRENILKKKK